MYDTTTAAQDENLQRGEGKKPVPSHRPALRPLDPLHPTVALTPAPSPLDIYQDEIFAHLSATEERSLPRADYMTHQTDINYKMRAILVDWLVSVHLKFKLMPETLFLTVNLIDRYLGKRVVNRQQLQLVGVTGMLLASKYEEIYPPDIKEFVYITDKAYTREQVLQMEGEMLSTLEFELTFPSAWRFLERAVRLANLEETYRYFARYLLELSLVEYHMLRHRSSLLAAAVTYIAMKVQRRDSTWTLPLTTATQYTESQLQPAIKDLLVLYQAAPRHTLTGVKDKFARRDYLEVSKLKIE